MCSSEFASSPAIALSVTMPGVAFSNKSTNVDTGGLLSASWANEDRIISQSPSERPSFFPFGGLGGLSPSTILFVTIGKDSFSGNGICPVNN